MNLQEMRQCARETLAFFIQTMPGVPFGPDDVEIVFAAKKDMVERFQTLCAKYAPERLRVLNDGHFEQLEHHIFGNAIIGRGKSAAIVRIDHGIDRDALRRIVFHELMHIYCGKTEMDGEHFIDIYGTGHTPDPDPEDRAYDGEVSAGYVVWSEFVAEYYAVTRTAPDKHYFSDITEPVFDLLGEVSAPNHESKISFAMMSAYVLSCADVEAALARIDGISDGSPSGRSAMEALQRCLVYLYEHVQGESPCKITEDFIHALGCKYVMFLALNRMYLSA